MNAFLALQDSGPVVTGIFLVLIGISFAVWFIIVERLLVLHTVRASCARFEQRFWSGESWKDLYEEIQNQATQPGHGSPAMFMMAVRVMQEGGNKKDSPALLDLRRLLNVYISRLEDSLDRALPLLALIASTAPYIGLLGTVWGIINAFDGIARAQTATLSAVAPGISEALVATALGLFAAIPAAIAHNRFAVAADRLVDSARAVADQLIAVSGQNRP